MINFIRRLNKYDWRNRDKYKKRIEENKNTSADRLRESIELARACGVPEEKILHNVKEIDEYFTGGEKE